MFKNMKIGLRLGLGFGLMVALMAVITAVGLRSLGQMDKAITEIVDESYPDTVIITDVRGQLNAVARSVRNLLLVKEKQDLDKEREKILEARKKIAELLGELEKRNQDEKSKVLIATVMEVRARYIANQNQIMGFIDAGKKDEATRFLLTEGRVVLAEYFDKLGNLVQFHADEMRTASAHAREASQSANRLMIILAAVALVLAAGGAFWVTRSITKPLNEAVAVANQLAEGDLSAKIEVTTRDEPGLLLAAMQNMVAKLSQIITEVRTSADSLSSASEEVSATAQSLSQAASEQAASVEETSASIEQMSASISQNTENSKVTDGMASKAAKEATEGGEAVNGTVAAMKQIAGKIGIIDDIAYQTNLLALNAAIEAARAGEHGKGFAVVAAEVRKLAERSQVAAQEIGEVASSSVELAEKAGKLLDEIVPSINKTSDLVQEISAASEEQSAGVGQINTAMSQISQTTQQNASASEQLAATAEEMSGQAEQLQQAVSFFKLERAPTSTGQTVKKAAKHTVTRFAGKVAAIASKATEGAPSEHEFVKF